MFLLLWITRCHWHYSGYPTGTAVEGRVYQLCLLHSFLDISFGGSKCVRSRIMSRWQVEEVVKRFPDVLSPVLVKAAQGAAASDFLRTEAFSQLAGVLQR